MAWRIADRTTITEQATEQILQQIKDGTFKPGDRLPSQREMSQHMGVGINAVREALQRLEVLGVIEVQQGRNAVVRPFSAELMLYDPGLFLVAAEKGSASQVFEVREILEVAVAGLAAQRATPDDVEAIRQVLGRQIAMDYSDYETYLRFNHEFHLAVVTAAHNPVLTRTITPLLGASRWLQNIFTPQVVAHWVELHRGIYEAIRDHNPEEARRAMMAHTALSLDHSRRAVDLELQEMQEQRATVPVGRA